MTRENIARKIDFVDSVMQSHFNDYGEETHRALREAINLILEQKTKTGHWITTRTFMHDGEYYCDKCKCDAPNNEKWDYCPNCGAKMESEVSE